MRQEVKFQKKMHKTAMQAALQYTVYTDRLKASTQMNSRNKRKMDPAIDSNGVDNTQNLGYGLNLQNSERTRMNSDFGNRQNSNGFGTNLEHDYLQNNSDLGKINISQNLQNISGTDQLNNININSNNNLFHTMPLQSTGMNYQNQPFNDTQPIADNQVLSNPLTQSQW